MIWEIVAVVIFGIGVAGVLLFFRSSQRFPLPLWIIPAACGLGMLGLQIFNEYTWFSHKTRQLSDSVKVIAEVEESVFWRPWSYIVPQVTKFVAININDTRGYPANGKDGQVELLFIERHMPARVFTAELDCTNSGSDISNRVTARETDNNRLDDNISINISDLCL